MKTSDRHLGGGLYIAAAILNSSRRNSGLDVAHVVNRTIDAFKNYLNVPDQLKVRIASCPGSFSGRYIHALRTVELSYKLNWRQTMEVLAHEMVHAEQYHEGRLSHTFQQGKFLWLWHGKTFRNRRVYAAYREQPWEQEAFDRQTMIADWVMADLNEQYGE